jgi:PRTRC genetic system protein E
MFRELMPLLKERTIMMTLSRIDDATIRVCVIPKRLKEDNKESTQENALCAPLAVTGTIDELDREFGDQLSRYSSSIVKLGANFEEIEAVHEAATKALKAENKKELDRQRGKSSGTKASPAEKSSGPVIKDGKPVFGSKDGQSPAETGTLFDAAPREEKVSTSAEGTTEETPTMPKAEVEATTALAELSSPQQGSHEGQASLTYPD